MPRSTQGEPHIPRTSLFRKFLSARQGAIAIMTILMIPSLMIATGVAIDYALVVAAQSKLDQAAHLATSAAANVALNKIKGDGVYYTDQAVLSAKYDEAMIAGQNAGLASFNAQATLLGNVQIDTNNTSFTVTHATNTITATASFRGQISTTLTRLIGVNSFPLSGRDQVTVAVSTALKEDLPNNQRNLLLIKEDWIPRGSVVNNQPSAPVINDWYSGTGGSNNPVAGADTAKAAIKGSIRLGGSDSQGDYAPIISKKVYLYPGPYELRYWYKSTLVYPDYEPIYVCGTKEQQMSWATSGRTRSLTSAKGSAAVDGGVANAQTSRAGVYLIPVPTDPLAASSAPTDASLARPPALGGNARVDNSSNRIDICAYSSRWIQRKILIDVITPGYFWLAFRAETPSTTPTSNGFLLGPVELCSFICWEPNTNNSPWTSYNFPANTGGTVLFRESFDTPTQNNGDAFNLTSGTFPPEAGYENPAQQWVVRDANNNVIGNQASDGRPAFVYGTYILGYPLATPVDGTQFLKVNRNFGGQIKRRILLLPGYYRINISAASLFNTTGCLYRQPYLLTFHRQDFQTTNSDDATGCGSYTRFTKCIRVATTQYFDIGLGAFDAPLTASNDQAYFDALSFEYLTNTHLDLTAAERTNACRYTRPTIGNFYDNYNLGGVQYLNFVGDVPPASQLRISPSYSIRTPIN